MPPRQSEDLKRGRKSISPPTAGDFLRRMRPLGDNQGYIQPPATRRAYAASEARHPRQRRQWRRRAEASEDACFDPSKALAGPSRRRKANSTPASKASPPTTLGLRSRNSTDISANSWRSRSPTRSKGTGHRAGARKGSSAKSPRLAHRSAALQAQISSLKRSARRTARSDGARARQDARPADRSTLRRSQLN